MDFNSQVEKDFLAIDDAMIDALEAKYGSISLVPASEWAAYKRKSDEIYLKMVCESKPPLMTGCDGRVKVGADYSVGAYYVSSDNQPGLNSWTHDANEAVTMFQSLCLIDDLLNQ